MIKIVMNSILYTKYEDKDKVKESMYIIDTEINKIRNLTDATCQAYNNHTEVLDDEGIKPPDKHVAHAKRIFKIVCDNYKINIEDKFEFRGPYSNINGLDIRFYISYNETYNSVHSINFNKLNAIISEFHIVKTRNYANAIDIQIPTIGEPYDPKYKLFYETLELTDDEIKLLLKLK